jgi:hypothetical protein
MRILLKNNVKLCTVSESAFLYRCPIILFDDIARKCKTKVMVNYIFPRVMTK